MFATVTYFSHLFGKCLINAFPSARAPGRQSNAVLMLLRTGLLLPPILFSMTLLPRSIRAMERLPSEGWPGPNEEMAFVVTGGAWNGDFQPVYNSAGYPYSASVIPLATDPATPSGGTGNCASAPQKSSAEAFGGTGLFIDGIYACCEEGSGPDDSTVWFVCPEGPAAFTDIQTAIDDSLVQDGDIIELCDDTFIGEYNRNLNFGSKVLTLRSASDNPDACVINCEGSEYPEHRMGIIFDGLVQTNIGSIVRGIKIWNGWNHEST